MLRCLRLTPNKNHWIWSGKHLWWKANMVVWILALSHVIQLWIRWYKARVLTFLGIQQNDWNCVLFNTHSSHHLPVPTLKNKSKTNSATKNKIKKKTVFFLFKDDQNLNVDKTKKLGFSDTWDLSLVSSPQLYHLLDSRLSYSFINSILAICQAHWLALDFKKAMWHGPSPLSLLQCSRGRQACKEAFVIQW